MMRGAVTATRSLWGSPDSGARIASDPSEGSLEAKCSALYEEHFEFVWRSLRRLGVGGASLDDAAQEVFVVVFRRLADFEGRSSVKTWLFGIAIHVAQHHLRAKKPLPSETPLESIEDDDTLDPYDAAVRAEAIDLLYKLLDELDSDKRAVFVMAELEQMTAPEMAEAAKVPVNTIYSRLRAARREFEMAMRRQKARTDWRRR